MALKSACLSKAGDSRMLRLWSSRVVNIVLESCKDDRSQNLRCGSTVDINKYISKDFLLADWLRTSMSLSLSSYLQNKANQNPAKMDQGGGAVGKVLAADT